ncbi:hypothetical protein GCM10010343_30190 [Streptomyces avidinii]|nr:hypothetical protein GCM10010343_30190 [Streptomyces avidinii]
MDHSHAPVLEAREDFRRRGDIAYGPPVTSRGAAWTPELPTLWDPDVFRADVLTLNGLDDRRQSEGVLSQAQDPTADAVGAEKAFFSTRKPAKSCCCRASRTSP